MCVCERERERERGEINTDGRQVPQQTLAHLSVLLIEQALIRRAHVSDLHGTWRDSATVWVPVYSNQNTNRSVGVALRWRSFCELLLPEVLIMDVLCVVL